MKSDLEKTFGDMKEIRAKLAAAETAEDKDAFQKSFDELSQKAIGLKADLQKAIDSAKQDADIQGTLDATKGFLTPNTPEGANLTGRGGAAPAAPVDHNQIERDKEAKFHKYMEFGKTMMSGQEMDLISPRGDAWEKAKGGAVMPRHLAVKMLGANWAVGTGLVDDYRKAVMVSSSPALGGDTVPQDFRLPVLDLEPEPNHILNRATVIPAPTGTVTMPKSVQDDSNEYGGMTGNWINEGGLKPATDTQFTQETIEAHEYAMHTQISERLLSRSSIAMEQWIARKGRQVVMDALDTAFINGDGVGKPLGFLQTAGIRGVARVTANDIDRKDPIRLKYGLKPYHRAGGTFVMDDSVLQALEELEDNEGRGLFSASMANGPFDRLSGYPFIVTTRTPDLGSEGDLSFIDLREYYVAMEQDVVVKRSDDYGFVNNLVTIAIFVVVGGKLVQPRVCAVLDDIIAS